MHEAMYCVDVDGHLAIDMYSIWLDCTGFFHNARKCHTKSCPPWAGTTSIPLGVCGWVLGFSIDKTIEGQLTAGDHSRL